MDMKKIKNVLTLLALVVVLGCTGCTGAARSNLAAYGMPHHIKQFSANQLIGEWDSTGMVSNEEQSDGFYFQDAATNKKVEVTGTLQITVK
jgi:hypothetical protein